MYACILDRVLFVLFKPEVLEFRGLRSGPPPILCFLGILMEVLLFNILMQLYLFSSNLIEKKEKNNVMNSNYSCPQ